MRKNCYVTKNRKATVSITSDPIDMDVLKKQVIKLVGEPIASKDDFLESLEVISYKSEALEPKPNCLVLIGTQPFSIAGELTNAFVKICGGVLTQAKSDDKLSIEELLNLNIDQLVLWKPEKNLGKQVTRIEELFNNDPILEQSFSKKLSIIDGEKVTANLDPKLALEVLCEILHPNEFDYGHKSEYWDVFESMDLRI